MHREKAAILLVLFPDSKEIVRLVSSLNDLSRYGFRDGPLLDQVALIASTGYVSTHVASAMSSLDLSSRELGSAIRGLIPQGLEPDCIRRLVLWWFDGLARTTPLG